MSETKKVKVFKKIKMKKPAPAPVKMEPENVPLEEETVKEENNFVFDEDDDLLPLPAQTSNNGGDEDEDDEFERLLNQFINSELEDIETGLEEVVAAPAPETSVQETSSQGIAQNTAPANNEPVLKEGEKALFEAYKNFTNSIIMMAGMKELDIPDFKLKASQLSPHYRPAIGVKIADDTLKGWDIMIKAQPNRLLSIQPNASDEELLDFAEKTTDEILQLAIISYVEILIEIEGCEITYEEKRLKAQRRKIEREIYEEHQRRIERKKAYIEAIEKKKFPIDATRLVTNYFKTAQKDPDGAYQVLVNNPAIYAPIDNSKIKPRLFGLIKVTPQDGIRVNREIGDFLKKVKA